MLVDSHVHQLFGYLFSLQTHTVCWFGCGIFVAFWGILSEDPSLHPCIHVVVPSLGFVFFLDVSKNSGTPKSSILIGFFIINHPFWGTPIFGNTQIGWYFQKKSKLVYSTQGKAKILIRFSTPKPESWWLEDDPFPFENGYLFEGRLLLVSGRVHPGRLTWNIQITHLERKMIFQTSMIMFHVNLAGCKHQGKNGTSFVDLSPSFKALIGHVQVAGVPDRAEPDGRLVSLVKNCLFFCWYTLPETNSSHLKMDGWKTILSLWVKSLFSGAMLVLGSVDWACFFPGFESLKVIRWYDEWWQNFAAIRWTSFFDFRNPLKKPQILMESRRFLGLKKKDLLLQHDSRVSNF